MKKLLILLVLIGIFPASTHAARLHFFGFEWQLLTANVEFTSNGLGAGWGSVDTGIKHSGAASFKNKPTVAAFSWVGHVFRADGSTGKAYARCYIRVAILSATNPIELCSFWDSVAANRRATVVLTSGGALQLLQDNDAQVGSDGPTLSLDTWYMIEISAEGTNAATEDIEGKVDGTSFASSAVATVGDFNAVYVGTPNANAVYEAYWDDIAVNDTTGSSQLAYPGAGNIAILVPTAAGYSACTTGTFGFIAEIPPSDTATSGSTMCELDANPTTGIFNVTDSSAAGIDSYDTVSVLQIMSRVREETSGATNWFPILSSNGNGTSTGSTVDTGDATARTNTSGTTPFGNMLISYTDPFTTAAWTPTGTNSIDSLQIGAGTTDGNPDTWLLTLAAFVEYVDGTPPAAGVVRQSEYWFD